MHWIEFLLLFFGVPLLIFFDREFIHPSIIILPVLIFIFIILRYTTDFTFKELFRWHIKRSDLIRNGIVMILSLLVLLCYTMVFERDQLFNLPRSNPWIYMAMCLFYPVFSAFGQEIVYRTFLYRRYKRIFNEHWQFVAASGISFSFMHIVYYDPVSIFFTFIAGLYLAQVYLKTRSVLFTSILHGILGIIVFGVGLGQYFWLDMPI